MRSWNSTRGRRPTTFAGTCSARVPRPRRPWPRWTASRSASRSGSARSRRSAASRGLYLEDIFVRPDLPRPRDRQSAAGRRGPAGRRARLRAAGMVGARLERARDRLLPRPRARGRWTSGPSTGSTTSRCDGWLRSRRSGETTEILTREDLSFDDPLRSTPHRADGRLRAGRAAAGGRIHQAQHQRESVSAVAAGQGGARRGGQRPAPALSRPDGDRVPPRRRASCTASSPTWSWRATARTTS